MFDDIYLRTPINKTASIVTAQSGCEKDMSLEDQRDSIRRAMKNLKERIDACVDKKEKKDLCIVLHNLSLESGNIRRLIAKRNVLMMDINEYILAEARKSMSKSAWMRIVKQANEAKMADMARVGG